MTIVGEGASSAVGRIAEQSPRRRGATVWFTGLSGAGKTTLSRAVAGELEGLGIETHLLDAAEIRARVSPDLGFTRADRDENVRRIAYVAGLLTGHGVVTLVAAMSPYRDGRDAVRREIASFVEVFVDAPLAVCEARDPVGLYRRYRAGEVHHLSGVDDPYEAPLEPEVHCRTGEETVEQCVARIVDAVLRSRSI